MPARSNERHRTGRIGWLRAAVLGANDGILSTSSLVLGVAAAHGTHSNILVAGVAGLVAGAMSMAAGEYVSVTRADTEQADLQLDCLSVFDFILQAHNFWGNGYWLSASNTKHRTIAFHQFCDHLNLQNSAKGNAPAVGSASGVVDVFLTALEVHL